MTLATRCTACGTAFRVVQDQLKIANGWVRCGRCAHVFDASGVLFVPEGVTVAGAAGVADSATPAVAPVGSVDTTPTNAASAGVPEDDASTAATQGAVSVSDADATSDATSDATPAATSVTVASSTPPIPPPTVASALPTSAVVDIGIGSVAPLPSLPAEPPADEPDEDPPDFVDARFNEELLAGFPGLRDPAERDDGQPPDQAAAGAFDSDRAAAPPDAAVRAADTAPVTTANTAAPILGPVQAPRGPSVSDAPTPTFMRQTRRAHTRRDGRAVRLALGASTLLLALGLAVQAAVHWRDVLAARWPPSAPWLATACSSVGCAIHPLRRIDDLAVDSTTLAPIAPDARALRLAVALVNHGDLPLAAPAVELSLTDSGGELIARKVLHPADFRADGKALTPSDTVHWQAVLQVSARAPEQRVAGYTVELFYP